MDETRENVEIGKVFLDKLKERTIKDDSPSLVAEYVDQALLQPINYLNSVLDESIEWVDVDDTIKNFSFQPLKQLGLSLINRKSKGENSKNLAKLESKLQKKTDKYTGINAIMQETEKSYNQLINNIQSLVNPSPGTILQRYLSDLSKLGNVPLPQKISTLSQLIEQYNAVHQQQEEQIQAIKGLPERALQLVQVTNDATRIIENYEVKPLQKDATCNDYMDVIENNVNSLKQQLLKEHSELIEAKKTLAEATYLVKTLNYAMNDAEEKLKNSQSIKIVPGLSTLINEKKDLNPEVRFRDWFSSFAVMNSYIVTKNQNGMNTMNQSGINFVQVIILMIFAFVLLRFF